MILAADQILLFVPAALALNLTPGADMMFCAGQGARLGPRAGLVSAAGISAGGMIHAGLAAAGLAAFLATHPALFEAVRWAGVLYLLWLAVQTLRARGRPADSASTGSASGGQPAPRARGALPASFRDAVAVSVLNPKVAIFILALLPQFVAPERGSPGAQMLALGALFSLGGFAVNGAVGVLAGGAFGIGARGGAGARLAARAAGPMRCVVAAIFAGLAARLAFARG
jgi:threonine/homoserine/homoserine lactone efflux protein